MTDEASKISSQMNIDDVSKNDDDSNDNEDHRGDRNDNACNDST